MNAPVEFLVCSSCQFENHPYCRFCLSCGLSLEDTRAIARPEASQLSELDPTQEAAPPTPGVQALVRRLAEDLGHRVEESGNGWRIRIELPGDRGQTVFVCFSGTDQDGDNVISFLSLAAPANPAVAHQLLRLNDSFHYGRVAALEVQGKQVYGVVARQLASTADEAEIQKMLQEVARRADSLEERLRGGADDY